MIDKENVKTDIDGYYWDVITTKQEDGTEKTITTPVRHNVITLPIKELLAGRLKGDAAFNEINFHAVGQGNPAWDTVPVAPTESDYPLTLEEYRKAPDIIDWINVSTGDVSATPTRIIQVKTTFDFGEMNPLGVYIREQGLFGGQATAAADSGEQVDNIRHPKIWKDDKVRMVRYIKLEF